ncbi:MAG: Lrp/AsnC family transcriptional regulator [Nitrososphaerales archaeon]
MDDIDLKIIEILKKDSRTPYIKIGEAVGLSEAAVRRRVQNLIQSGVIKKFTIEVETGGANAITLLTISSSTPTQKVSEKLKELKNVEVVHEITGQFDIAVFISASNIAEINKCIDDIRKIEGVITSNTVIILRTIR